jgi:hypothetical protein
VADALSSMDFARSGLLADATNALQVVRRRCTICDWQAQVIENPSDEEPLCPWCYGLTERASIVGTVVPQHIGRGEKNPLAASLGRLGGLKGGRARAQKLSAKRRSEIASKAARARWAKRRRS